MTSEARVTASVRAPRNTEDLAVFGGPPAFIEARHVGRPNIGDRAAVHERIDGALDRRWLANDGPLVAEFEDRVAELTGVSHCVATASATAGLQLVARALDLTGEVVMPSWTFVGTAHALAWLGITPVFCDIDPGTHNLNPAAAERCITPRTSAILGVHLWGRSCHVDALEALAARRGVSLVFDAAHATGCGTGAKPIGGAGRAEVFSFHATKVASAGEGGAVTTNDAALARRVRLMRNFGFAGYDLVTELGTNAKMNELTAAMGLTSLESLDEFIAVNRDHHDRYSRELGGVPGLRVVAYPAEERQNYQYVVLEVEHRQLRQDLIAVLHAENVLARRYFSPGAHRMEPYSREPVHLPATEALAERVLVLPTGTAISATDVTTICTIIRLAVQDADAVREQVARG